MEAIGTYISVVGLGSLFAGDPVILTMACIFDVAKIASVSFLYQNWQYIKSTMKYYFLVAVIVLMTITSGGVFGYLSGAFQKAMAPNMSVTLKVDSYNRERDQLLNERVELIKQRANIDTQIAGVTSEDVDVKRRLMWSFKPESKRISERLIVVTKRVDDLNAIVLKVESENIDSRVHAGPIVYVAKAFNTSVEEASKYIILTIIFVFDPLAVMLLLAGNFLVKKRKDDKALPKYPEPPAPPPVKVEPVVEPIDDFTQTQIDEFVKNQAEEAKSSEAPESMLMVEPSSKFDEDTWEPQQAAPIVEELKPEPIDVMKLWGKTPGAEYGQRPEDISTPYELSAKPKVTIAKEPTIAEQYAESILNKVYGDFDSGEAPTEDRIPDTMEEPSDDYENVVEDYVPVEPIESYNEYHEKQDLTQPEMTAPIIDVQPTVQESSPQAELIEETPNGLNVQELIAAAKKRVNKKRASPTKIEPKAAEEKPKHEGPLMTSTLESLKIGTAGAMLGGGHPESHVRGIYE